VHAPQKEGSTAPKKARRYPSQRAVSPVKDEQRGKVAVRKRVCPLMGKKPKKELG